MNLRLTFSLAVNQTRDFAYSMWTAILPPVLLVGLAVAFPRLDRTALLTGVLAFTGATAAFACLPLTFHQLVESGAVKRMRLTPRGAAGVPAAIIAANILMLLIEFALVTGIAGILGMLPSGFPLAAAAWEAYYAVTLVSAGFIVAALGRDLLAAKNIGNLAMLAAMAASGVFFRLPGIAGILHTLDPVGAFVSGFSSALQGAPQDLLGLAVPAFWALAGIAAAAGALRKASAEGSDARRVAEAGMSGYVDADTTGWKESGIEQRPVSGRTGPVRLGLIQFARRPQWAAVELGLSVAGVLVARFAFPRDWPSLMPYVLGILLPMGILSGAVWDLARIRESRLLRRFALAPRGLLKASIAALAPSVVMYAVTFGVVAPLCLLLGYPGNRADALLTAGSLLALFCTGVVVVPTLAVAVSRLSRSSVAAVTWAPFVWLATALPVLLQGAGARPESWMKALRSAAPASFLHALADPSGAAGIAAEPVHIAASAVLWVILGLLALRRSATSLPGR